jgi:hypothetical protein
MNNTPKKIFFNLMPFGKESICSLYQSALTFSYEFNLEKAYLKYIFTLNYVTKMIKNKIEKDKITETIDLVCNSCTLESLDDNFLRPEILESICNSSSLSPSIFYDTYYSFIFSDYSSKILQWRQRKKISQKKAAKILKISPVDICDWERKISYPSRYQFIKLQEVIK